MNALIGFLESNKGLYIEGNKFCTLHQNTDLFDYLNIEFAGAGRDNEVTLLQSIDESRLGERSFGYQTRDGMAYAAAEPDRMRPGNDSEIILTCNQDFARGIFFDGGGAYRTYVQTISFIAMNNNHDFNRAEYLRDVINELAGFLGTLQGTVLNNMTGEPVPNATVEVPGQNLHALTDENGAFEIRGIPHEQFGIEISARGFTSAFIENVDFDGEQELEIEVHLLHPELALDRENLSINLAENAQQNVSITITNTGDGPLEFSADLRGASIPGHIFDEFESVDASELLGNTRIQAGIFLDGYYWIAGGGPDADSPNLLYKLTPELEIIDQFAQSSESRYGWRDLTSDGTFIYAIDTDIITQISPESGEDTGNSIQSGAIPRFVRGITYDPENELFWVASTTSDIFAIDRNGDQVEQVDNDGRFRSYGLAWNSNDPDGYRLLIQSTVNSISTLMKCNTETDELTEVISYQLPDGEKPCGGDVSNEIYPFTNTLVVIGQGREDWLRTIELGKNFFWIDFEPSEGELNPEGELDIEVLISTEGLEADHQHSAFLQIEHNTPLDVPMWLEISVSVGGDQNARELLVPLSAGWNMISMNIEPNEDFWNREEGPDVILLTDQLSLRENHHHLEILKDEDGRFYVPAFNFNNIPYWELTEGYQAKVEDDFEVVWSGEPIPADSDISLEAGWNLIAYFPQFNLDAGTPDFYVLSPIIDNVLIAKNSVGDFMLPAFNFSNMPPWHETQGYQVKVEENVVLNFPPQQEELAGVGNPSETRHNYLINTANTDHNMSLLVVAGAGLDIGEGDMIIAVNSDERLIGSGKVQDDGRCGIAIWGDDLMTEIQDGLSADETFSLWLQPDESEKQLELRVSELIVGKGLEYHQDGLSVITVDPVQEVPKAFSMSQIYPNPFNNIARISFGLPEETRAIINLFDINGRLVVEIADQVYEAGSHSISWHAETISAGLYIIQMQVGTFEASRKVVLVK